MEFAAPVGQHQHVGMLTASVTRQRQRVIRPRWLITIGDTGRRRRCRWLVWYRLSSCIDNINSLVRRHAAYARRSLVSCLAIIVDIVVIIGIVNIRHHITLLFDGGHCRPDHIVIMATTLLVVITLRHAINYGRDALSLLHITLPANVASC